MFTILGKSIVRYWMIYVAIWAGLLFLGWRFAPAWDAVTTSGEVEFLPAESPSRKAEEFFKEAYPLESMASNIALVIWRRDKKLQEEDRQFITNEISVKVRELAG